MGRPQLPRDADLRESTDNTNHSTGKPSGLPARACRSAFSTLADQVGAAAHALMPLYKLIEAHVLAAPRIHGDDTNRAGHGEGQDRYGPIMGLRAR